MFKKIMSMITAAVMLACGLSLLPLQSASALSSDASLNVSSSTIKGVTISSANGRTCLDGPGCAGFPANQVSVSISPTQAANTSNSGSFVTLLVPTDSGATVTKIVKYPSSTPGFNILGFNSATAFDPTTTISDGDYLIAEVTPASGALDIKWYGFVVRVVSNDSSLSSISKIKGQAITDFGTPHATYSDSSGAGAVTISTSAANDTSNTGSYVTRFRATNMMANVMKVAKYSSGSTPTESAFNSATNYSSLAISDGDFFIIKVIAQDMSTVGFYRIVVTVSDGPAPAPSPSPSPTPSADAAVAARAAAEAARVAAIAKARSGLVDTIKIQKPASLSDYQSADFNVKSQATVDRINKDVLALQAKTPTTTLSTDAIKAVVARENFVEQVSTVATQATVLPKDLVAAGVIPADNKYKTSVLLGLQTLPTSQLDTYEKIQAAVANQLAIIKARADRLAAGKIRLAKRLAKP